MCAAVLVAAAPGVSQVLDRAAGASTGRAPNAEFCSGFADYFAASVVVQFAVGLADSFDTKHTGKAEEVRSSFLLVLSPKLELITRTMARSGPTLLRGAFAKQAKAFGIGVKLLRGAGLTDAQITQIAHATIDSTDTSLEQLTAKIDVSAAAIRKASNTFKKQVNAVDLGKVPNESSDRRSAPPGRNAASFRCRASTAPRSSRQTKRSPHWVSLWTWTPSRRACTSGPHRRPATHRA